MKSRRKPLSGVLSIFTTLSYCLNEWIKVLTKHTVHVLISFLMYLNYNILLRELTAALGCPGMDTGGIIGRG